MHAITLLGEALRVPARMPGAGAAALPGPPRQTTESRESGGGGGKDSLEPATGRPPQASHTFENGPERDAIRRRI